MRFSLPQAWSPIGLDIGTQRVNAVQLDALGRVRAYAAFARREPEADLTIVEAARIRNVLDRHGFRGCSTVIAAPRHLVRETILDLPPASSGAPIAQLAVAELGRIHKLAPGSFSMGMWELPASSRSSGGCQTMAVTCPSSASEELCDVLESAGIEPVAIDTAGCALVRALPVDPLGTQAVLELAESRTTLLVIHQGILVFERPLSELTMRLLRSRLAKALRVSVQEAGRLLAERGLLKADENLAMIETLRPLIDPLVEEVAQSGAYASSRYTDAAISQVFLVGRGASVPGLAEYLGESLECDFVAPCLSELAPMRGAMAERAAAGEGLIALGLARWRAEVAS
ncbi:MAG: pilus assembly protein PilM [Phycisphaerales bacterium]